MQRLVALKISRDRSLEPQTLAQLEHPHIVRVFDQRALPEHKLRLLYMQYVPGGTLQGVVTHLRKIPPAARGGGSLLEAVDKALAHNGEEPPADSLTRYKLRSATWPEVVCWLGARLAGALGHAHQHGVLHRDIKPANVLVGADGHPKLADFNISFSKLDGATPAAYFGGTLAYMSPEQLEAYDPANSPARRVGRAGGYLFAGRAAMGTAHAQAAICRCFAARGLVEGPAADGEHSLRRTFARHAGPGPGRLPGDRGRRAGEMPVA